MHYEPRYEEALPFLRGDLKSRTLVFLEYLRMEVNGGCCACTLSVVHEPAAEGKERLVDQTGIEPVTS